MSNTEFELEESAEQIAAREAAAVEAASTAAATFEQRARLMGWKDKSEFDRPPERWVDAETYVRRGENTLPIIKENYRALEQKFNATDTELRATRAAVDHLREMSTAAEARAYDRAKRDFERERTYLESQRDAAVAVADVNTARTISRQIETLREPEPFKVTTPAAPAVRPTVAPAADAAETASVTAFVQAESKWFHGDREAGDFASARYGTLQATRPDLTVEQRLAEVKRAVMKRFPEHFESAAAARPAAVTAPSPGGGAPRRAKGWTWEDIPSSDRSTAEKVIADVNKGVKDKTKLFTREEYLKTYFAGQEKS